MNNPSESDREILTILADYSYDLANLKKRNGKLPAQAAMERIKAWGDKAVLETVKAYGACTNCYGKGYSTVRHSETYRGATHNMRTEMKFCNCDRGEQLARLMGEAVLKTRIDELERATGSFTDSGLKYVQLRIAALQAQQEHP